MPIAATLEIRGIRELKDALGRLPDELKGQATGIVMDAALAAKADIEASYPQGPTGHLKKGVKVKVQEIGPFKVAAQVRSSAPHAHLYEFGTQARHTKKGWNRGTMPAPPAPVFIPAMVRYRRLMYQKLAEIIRATGLTVTLDG